MEILQNIFWRLVSDTLPQTFVSCSSGTIQLTSFYLTNRFYGSDYPCLWSSSKSVDPSMVFWRIEAAAPHKSIVWTAMVRFPISAKPFCRFLAYSWTLNKNSKTLLLMWGIEPSLFRLSSCAVRAAFAHFEHPKGHRRVNRFWRNFTDRGNRTRRIDWSNKTVTILWFPSSWRRKFEAAWWNLVENVKIEIFAVHQTIRHGRKPIKTLW